MKLERYLEMSGETQAAFGARIGVTDSYINKLCAGKMRPSLERIDDITAATDGAVRVDDWPRSQARRGARGDE